MKHLFSILASCMVVMSACTQEEETAVKSLPNDNLIRVTTGVSPNVTASVTRGGYETNTLKEFGFFVSNPISDRYTYNNVKMTKEGEEWKSAVGDMYWMSRLQLVTVVAYAPYRAEFPTIDSKITANVLADQTTVQNLLASDFIGMKVDSFIPKIGEGGDLSDQGQVPIGMQHLMSKVKISIEYPSKLNSLDNTNPISMIKIGGAYLKGICDFSAWFINDFSTVITVNRDEPSPEIVIPFAENFSQNAEGGLATYECILVPQTINLMTIDFVIGGISYAWNYEKLKLKAGTMHKINLKIIGRKVEFGSDVSVDDWVDNGEGEITSPLDEKDK